jgi:hypothetical protein
VDDCQTLRYGESPVDGAVLPVVVTILLSLKRRSIKKREVVRGKKLPL